MTIQYHHIPSHLCCVWQIAKVERYEAKLGVMAFIGVFDELMRTVMPVSLLLFFVVVVFWFLFGGGRGGFTVGFSSDIECAQ